MRTKKDLNLIQISIMNLAFLGLQAGMAFEIANISAIYELFGVTPSLIPILWIAPFISGLFVQPIVGVMSDNTWCFLGRRRPYILIGSLISAGSLLIMVLSSNLIVLVLAVWGFSIFTNVIMGPLRTYIADILNEEQMTIGFSIQSIFMAFGSILASCLPIIIASLDTKINNDGSTRVLYYSALFCVVFILLSGLITSFCGKEYKTENKEPIKDNKPKNNYFKELINDFMNMPKPMKELSIVHFFGWMGIFLMFMYFPIAIAGDVFSALPGTPDYLYAIEWGGLCFGVYSTVQFIISFFLPALCKRFGDKRIYLLCMFLGGIGLLSEIIITNKYLLFIPMCGVGIMYAAINIIPYSILGNVLPDAKKGAYIGLFNIFITAPGILVSLSFGFIITLVFGSDKTWGVGCAGFCMLIAALFILKSRYIQTKVQ